MYFLISGLSVIYIYLGCKFAFKIFFNAGIYENDDAFEVGFTFVVVTIAWPLFAFMSVMYGVFAAIGKRIKSED